MQLKVKIMRQQAAREQKLRRKNLTKYIPNAAAAVFKVLQSMAQAPAVGSKRRRLQEEEDILESVAQGETVEATLAQRLTEYVERIDTDMVSWLQAGEHVSSCHQAFAPAQYVYVPVATFRFCFRQDFSQIILGPWERFWLPTHLPSCKGPLRCLLVNCLLFEVCQPPGRP